MAEAAEAIAVIISDPINFLGILFEGMKAGFDNFEANIWTHLTTGLVEWLTGTMSGVGLTIPDNLVGKLYKPL